MTSRRIFVAGITGAIGRRLVPLLVSAGHDVTGSTRRPEQADRLRTLGVRPVVVDAYEADAVTAAVASARPEVVINQLTDLGGSTDGGLSDDRLARTARLRSVGTATLVRAAVAAGCSRFIVQSLALCYAPGPEPHTEDDPLGVSERWMSITLPGVVELERLVRGEPAIEGFVLRYGLLYGPGAATEGPDDPIAVHVDAAAWAAALAVDHGVPGIYNVVDDGGPVSNAKARSELGWRPDLRLPT
jgi:nucleoside-diphosphate-sugar epimerase